MRRIAAVFCIALLGSPLRADPPPLVVLLVVDQMRADYLERFAPEFSGGLAELLRSGAQYADAHHAHAITATAPGHATLGTGVHPARHGIPANVFWDDATGALRYAAADDDVVIVGAPGDSGRSPAQLRHGTVGDWLRTASPESKVFAVSGKDRAAILMGGHVPDGVYWYHRYRGTFVTSSYYTDALPAWVQAFNAATSPLQYAADGWQRTRPDEAYALAREDAFPAESDGIDIVFPHRFRDDDGAALDSLTPDEHAAVLSRFYGSPFLDAMVLDFTRALIAEEQLGRDATPDLLLLSLSAADLIGHEFGPLSHEVADEYFRLDALLGAFFATLDTVVGSGKWSVIVSADHGSPLIVEEYQRQGLAAQRVTLADVEQALVPPLQQVLFDARVPEVPRISASFPFGITLAFPPGSVTGDQQRQVRAAVAEGIRNAPWAIDAFTRDELAADSTPDRAYLTPFRRSFVPDRAPDVAVVYAERHFLSLGLVVNHGTPHAYDTHVPLIVRGPGIAPARYDRRVHTVDVAPTVAALLGITPPDGLDGQALTEVVPTR